VDTLRRDERRFRQWLDHVRTAIPDIEDIDVIERPDDRHRYIVVRYAGGAAVPSWLVSDGTLRLLALTILAYLKDPAGVIMVEEPENGIHPRAIETAIQSLSSIYDGQVLLATHSPVALNMLEPKDVLCFAKDSEGATDIVSGDAHPALRDWKAGEPDFGVLFASGMPMPDLVVLVADKNMEYALRAGLERHEALGIRPISFHVVQHAERDSGVRTTGAQLVGLERRNFTHALVILDHEGSGADVLPEVLEEQLDRQLTAQWGSQAKAIVIHPELEAWIWGSDNALKQLLNWPYETGIRDWLEERDYEISADWKPKRPKEALESVLQACRIPRSSAIYRKIAERISISRCTDPAVGRLRAQLSRWFPPT
jgi:hypothetical protein